MKDRPLEAALLYEEAHARRAEGNPSGALARYRRLLEVAAALDDAVWCGDLCFEMGDMYQGAGDGLEARRWYGRALDAYARPGDQARAAETRRRSGEAEQLLGAMEAAEQLFQEALAGARAVEDRAIEGRALSSLGNLWWELGRADEGAAAMIQGLRLLDLAAPGDAARVQEQIRAWSRRIGNAPYRRIIEATAGDPDLYARLI